MTARILDGRAVASEVRADVARRVAALKEKGVTPGLSVVLVGDDPASHTYVRNKERDAKEAGFAGSVVRLPADASQADAEAAVRRLNDDAAVHGFLVQLPLPKGLESDRILSLLDPAKDVDGFHPFNQGLLLQGRPRFVPATPAGVLELIRRVGLPTPGARAVVLGRSTIVGKPLAALLASKGVDMTVTLAHSKTKALNAVCREGDVLVAAAGVPGLVSPDMVKPGATVIDVGTTVVDGKLRGDVEFDGVKEIAGWITPVPGGVGPMTRAMLLRNAVLAAERSAGV